MTGRRELQVAVLLCLLGATVLLFAVTRVWVTVEDTRQLTIDAVRTSVRGGRIAAGAQALGYVGLAGVVALAATRRAGRVVVGGLLLMAGLGVVAVVIRVLADDGAAGRGLRAVGSCGSSCSAHAGTAWPALTVAGGVLLALSGLLVALRGRRWAALSSSYEPPAARVEAPVTDKGVWEALDRGEDPT